MVPELLDPTPVFQLSLALCGRSSIVLVFRSSHARPVSVRLAAGMDRDHRSGEDDAWLCLETFQRTASPLARAEQNLRAAWLQTVAK